MIALRPFGSTAKGTAASSAGLAPFATVLVTMVPRVSASLPSTQDLMKYPRGLPKTICVLVKFSAILLPHRSRFRRLGLRVRLRFLDLLIPWIIRPTGERQTATGQRQTEKANEQTHFEDSDLE